MFDTVKLTITLQNWYITEFYLRRSFSDGAIPRLFLLTLQQNWFAF